MTLEKLESKSIYILREAYNKFGKNMALLWSIGKDSTILIHLSKKAFFNKIPFPVIHIDTTFKFPEMYEFRDKYAKKWGLNLIVAKNDSALKKDVNYQNNTIEECCHHLKTVALQQTIKKYKLKALIVGIRRDEHGIRGKERYFSHRNKNSNWDYLNQPAELWDQFIAENKEGHYRIHPLLHWTEVDIWRYIKKENIPVNPLYFSKKELRYRSLGDMPITSPIKSNASNVNEIINEISKTKIKERSGRNMDKENNYSMQKLRSLGYM